MKRPSALRFSNLVGSLTDADHMRVLHTTQAELLDFDKLNTSAAAISEQVKGRLFQQFGITTIVDYGDEPVIAQAIDEMLLVLLKEVEVKYPFLKQSFTALFKEVCDFTPILAAPDDDPIGKGRRLLELVGKTKDRLLVCLINAEIIDVIDKVYFEQFNRHFMRKMYSVLGPRSKQFRDFLFHAVLVGVAKHLKFLVAEWKEQLGLVDLAKGPESSFTLRVIRDNKRREGHLREYFTEVNEQLIIDKQFDPELMDVITTLDKEVQHQDEMVASYRVFLGIVIERIAVKSSDEAVYRTLYDTFRKEGPASTPTYYDVLYHLPQKIDKDAPEETPVLQKSDLILIYAWVILASSNAFGLNISAYLYTRHLNVSPALSGVLQAGIPVGALCWTFGWNYFTHLKTYKTPLLLYTIFSGVGNLLYYLAQTTVDYDSRAVNGRGIAMIVIGRLLMDVGSARSSTRKYIAVTIRSFALTRYTAVFILCTVFAMFLGGLIQALIFYAPFGPTSCRSLGATQLCHHNMLALIYVFLWIVQFVVFFFLFQGEDKKKLLLERNRKFDKMPVLSAVSELSYDAHAFRMKRKPPLKMKMSDIVAYQHGDRRGSAHDSRVIDSRGPEPKTAAEHKYPIPGKVPTNQGSRVINTPDFFSKLLVKYHKEKAPRGHMEVLVTETDILEGAISPGTVGKVEKKAAQVAGHQAKDNWRSNVHFHVRFPWVFPFFAIFVLFVNRVS